MSPPLPRAFQRVPHPTDFSDCADAVFNIIKRLRPAGTEEVILLHVQDERAMRQWPPEQLGVMLRRGIPFVEGLRVAEEEDVCRLSWVPKAAALGRR